MPQATWADNVLELAIASLSWLPNMLLSMTTSEIGASAHSSIFLCQRSSAITQSKICHAMDSPQRQQNDATRRKGKTVNALQKGCVFMLRHAIASRKSP
eukprot:scaffold649_cov347-Pavlova_lutheri.AAC.39